MVIIRYVASLYKLSSAICFNFSSLTKNGTACLRAFAGNASHIKIFLILCIQFVLCMDCQFMKYIVLRICHHDQFFIISHGLQPCNLAAHETSSYI